MNGSTVRCQRRKIQPNSTVCGYILKGGSWTHIILSTLILLANVFGEKTNEWFSDQKENPIVWGNILKGGSWTNFISSTLFLVVNVFGEKTIKGSLAHK